MLLFISKCDVNISSILTNRNHETMFIFMLLIMGVHEPRNLLSDIDVKYCLNVFLYKSPVWEVDAGVDFEILYCCKQLWILTSRALCVILRRFCVLWRYHWINKIRQKIVFELMNKFEYLCQCYGKHRNLHNFEAVPNSKIHSNEVIFFITALS